jgi:DNA (cytosine-5)-methyltransferase 1
LRRFRADLTRAGYDLGDAVLHASVFGVPQRRARYLLIGSRRGRVELPSPTHGPGLRPYSTVRDWIGGLPPLRAGQSSSKDSSHCASALSPENMKRIQCTPEGGGRESWPKKLLLACHQQTAGHSDVYGRLAFAGLAAALTTRCISYSNGRFGHPRQHRAITPREAGCLQTFPRTHVFVGSITSQAKQIGNAVPPLVAQRLGEAIASHIDQLQRTSVRGRGTSRSAPRP